MSNCIFCKIISHEAPAEFLLEDGVCVVFRNIHPKAPIHLLVVPRTHVESLVEAADDKMLLGSLLSAAHRVATLQGLDNGYKVVINVGKEGGQVVPHLHVHILGGRQMEE